MAKQEIAKLAFRFVLIVGIVNFFADMTYEGARSITGPFLGSLGAGATVIGFVAGFGELLGYGLRFVSGYFADKTRQYWAVIFIGYFINMLAVPALALAGNWPLAAAFIIAERTGKAIRRPAVEAMLSHAGKSIGHGWVFGLNEALDQAGATIGPLIAALVLYLHGSYQHAFSVLLVSAFLCLSAVVAARVFHANPENLEEPSAALPQTKGFSTAYWLYFFAGGLIAAGFADFSLIAFHFHKTGTVHQAAIPLFYSLAMGMGAIAALVFGKLLDKFGRSALLLAFLISALFPPFIFGGGWLPALVGMILWGIGIGAQDSMLKAVLAELIPEKKRSMGFGLFDAGFGVAWFLGSALMGFLYDHSIPALIGFSVATQLAALPVFFFAKRRSQAESEAGVILAAR